MFFKINNSHFNCHQNTIIINGKPIDCPTKVSQALLLFLESKNNVINKEKLMNKLWDDLIVSDDSLFKIVQGVRKVLSESGLDDNTLINVYGKGYKITPIIDVINKSFDTATIKSKYFKKPAITVTLIFIVSVLIVINYNNKSLETINQHAYSDLKKIGESNSPELLALLKTQYSNQKLATQDKIRLNYLQGFAYYKQGSYTNSIKNLETAVKLSDSIEPIKATADAYLMLARIYVFKAKYQLMWQYLDNAEEIYAQFKDQQGLLSVMLSRGRYYIGTDEFEKSLKVFDELIKASKTNNDLIHQIYALKNSSYVHQLLGNEQESIKQLNSMLELSLKKGHGASIAYAYGALSQSNMNAGDFNMAMKQAILTIRYAIDQNDTNRFQQSFSSFYNILNDLGHDQLAEKYLHKAIDFQNSRNSDGHLHEAELNLGIVKLQSKKYLEAQDLFETILSYPLTDAFKLETTAWLAITRYFQKDNIGAFSLAQEIYNNDNTIGKAKIMAGICLALAEFELERYTQSQLVFTEISKLDKSKWPVVNSFFLNMALYVLANKNPDKYNKYLDEKQDFDMKFTIVKRDTTPEQSFITALDNYLETTFIP